MDEKFTKVLRQLLKRTEQSEVRWKESPYDDGYVVKLGNASVRVRKISGWSENREFDYIASILDSDGDVVDEFETSSFSSEEFFEHFDLFSDLFRIARRVASGADELLNELIDTLKDDEDDIPF